MKLAELKVDVEGPLVCATLRGDIDLSNAEELRDDLTRAMPNDALGLILDLSDITYLDSAGIHLVHRLRESLRARGQAMRLIIPHDSVINDTLRLAGFDWRDEVAESLAEARRALEGLRPA